MKSSRSIARAKRVALCAALLAVIPALAAAQPAGCTWEGDPAFRYGWNYLDELPYNQPGPDAATIYPGQTIVRTLGPYNAHPTWLPPGCKGADTLCFHAVSKSGWILDGDPPFGTPEIMPGGGYLWYQDVSIVAPCSAEPGDVDTVIAICAYVNNAGVCDPSCGDCNDPNTRPADGKFYYSRDTLYVTVVAPPGAVAVFQDTLTLVELGQSAAYIPFTICNQNECAPLTTFSYSILTTGHIPTTIPGSSVEVEGGKCKDIYAILNAEYAGSVEACTFDTLTIVAWSGSSYDTCAQVVHVVDGCCSPVLSLPALAVLIAALAAAVAFFFKRRLAATS